jgi:hypothetical protein
MSDTDEPVFSVTAMGYRTNGAAAAAYERIVRVFARWSESGDSFYRFTLNGEPTLSVVAWSPAEEHMAAIASLPWGTGEPVVLPAGVCEQLARRSIEAAPHRRHSIRRVYRDPTGAVLRDEELPEAEAAAPAADEYDAGQQ